jgi:hypothetical protein
LCILIQAKPLPRGEARRAVQIENNHIVATLKVQQEENGGPSSWGPRRADHNMPESPENGIKTGTGA